MDEIENDISKKNKLKETKKCVKDSDESDTDGSPTVKKSKYLDKKKEEEKEEPKDEDEASMSPPPPPPPSDNGPEAMQPLNRGGRPRRRKSSTLEKNIRELELMKQKTMARKTAMEQRPSKDDVFVNDDDNEEDDEDNLITIRVSSKKGIEKFEIGMVGINTQIHSYNAYNIIFYKKNITKKGSNISSDFRSASQNGEHGRRVRNLVA